jgi:hypothetical protein
MVVNHLLRTSHAAEQALSPARGPAQAAPDITRMFDDTCPPKRIKITINLKSEI